MGDGNKVKEFRVCWNASSNITFAGASDWEEWYGDASDEEIENELFRTDGGIGEALDIALDISGFNYWVEIRTKNDDGN